MVTFADLEAEVRKLASENPDYVYPQSNCYYQREGEPQCIFGKALSNLGLKAPAIAEGTAISGVFRYVNIRADDAQETWAHRVQGRQDRSHSWSYAVNYADEFVGTTNRS